MKCPICGCKIKYGECPYCKVTDNQIKSSSNVLAKQAIKNKQSQNVVFSNIIPDDVNIKKLWLLTILGGLIGLQNFYVGRLYKALYNLISFSLTIIMLVASVIFINNVTAFIFEISIYIFAVNVLFWFNDIFNLVFKHFKMPVIMNEKDK